MAASTVPTDVKMPGTQPDGVDSPPTFISVSNCGCHDGINGANVHLDPVFGWRGAMMGNAGRDPLFWSTLAIAEQDFLPNATVANRGGVGDLCIKCHSTNGWLRGRSVPTNGSALSTSADTEGIMCHFCHVITNPDQENSIPNPPEGEYLEEQNAPFFAYDELSGEGYYGAAEYVLNQDGTRLGPYLTNSNHDVIQSPYFRDARMCGTCHDVSNPAVGDLAHNHGSMYPFMGVYNGTVNGLITEKAALNNQPHSYGIVERTFSEWLTSGLDTLLVNNFGTLPSELQQPGKALDYAYHRSYDALGDANYVDGALRYYSCQTCHMPASTGKGAQQGPTRTDMPQHDQTGGSYWIQLATQYQNTKGTLRFGTGLTTTQITAMNHAMQRAGSQLAMAADISAEQVGTDLLVKVTNFTGHKLISGYPEGRRMWLNIKWYDAGDALISENGAYGPIGNIVQDLVGTSFDVQSILDLGSTKIYEAKPGLTQEWAAQLISLGYPSTLPLTWNRLNNSVYKTLGDLALEPAGTIYSTFHFVLNNAIYSDNRIPPYGFAYDDADARNTLPVPDTQFGNPGPGGVFDYWDEAAFTIPSGADHAEISLFYQSTSWEYIQFLWKQNDTLDPFLGAEGINMLDAWLNTSMCPPFEMAATTVTGIVASAGPPGEAGTDSPLLLVKSTDNVDFSWGSPGATCDLSTYALYAGDVLSLASGYSYQEALTCVEAGSTLSMAINDPQISFSPAIFFIVVSNNGTSEGSYGKESEAGVERDPAPLTGFCFGTVQNLSDCPL